MRALTLENEIAELKKRVAELEGANWQKLTAAAKLLGYHPNTIKYKIQRSPHIYRLGICWKWNDAGTFRLINITAWRKASGQN